MYKKKAASVLPLGVVHVIVMPHVFVLEIQSRQLMPEYHFSR